MIHKKPDGKKTNIADRVNMFRTGIIVTQAVACLLLAIIGVAQGLAEYLLRETEQRDSAVK